jgi:single-strand DNA-binding protein
MSDLRLPTLNKIVIAGRCTRDPEVRFLQSGTAVATIGLASSRAYKDPKDPAGDWKEEVCFVNVVAWGPLAERCGDSLRKGSAALVEGRLQSRSWDGEDGKKRSTIEIRADRIQFLDRNRSDGSSGSGYGSEPATVDTGSSLPSDDLPF